VWLKVAPTVLLLGEFVVKEVLQKIGVDPSSVVEIRNVKERPFVGYFIMERDGRYWIGRDGSVWYRNLGIEVLAWAWDRMERGVRKNEG